MENYNDIRIVRSLSKIFGINLLKNYRILKNSDVTFIVDQHCQHFCFNCKFSDYFQRTENVYQEMTGNELKLMLGCH